MREMSCVVSRRTVSAAAGWWLLCAVVSLLVRSTVQEGEWLIPRTLWEAVIDCMAVTILHDMQAAASNSCDYCESCKPQQTIT